MLIIFVNVPCDEYSSLNNFGKEIHRIKLVRISLILLHIIPLHLNGMDWKFMCFTYPVGVKNAISPHGEYLVYFLGFGSRNDKHLTSGESYAVLKKVNISIYIPFY